MKATIARRQLLSVQFFDGQRVFLPTISANKVRRGHGAVVGIPGPTTVLDCGQTTRCEEGTPGGTSRPGMLRRAPWPENTNCVPRTAGTMVKAANPFGAPAKLMDRIK